jgi:hypothetical protein
MKKVIFILAIIGLVFSTSSCGNKKKKESSATHAHEDGTVHGGATHGQANEAKPNQESFEVKADDDAEHKHENGDNDSAEHKHEHEGEHTHEDGTEHADHK